MGVGGTGDNRAQDAAKQAISRPLLETSIDGATGVLINFTGGVDLGALEVNEAADIVREAADPDANIIFGAVIDETLKDEIRITVIAPTIIFASGSTASRTTSAASYTSNAPRSAPPVKFIITSVAPSIDVSNSGDDIACLNSILCSIITFTKSNSHMS